MGVVGEIVVAKAGGPGNFGVKLLDAWSLVDADRIVVLADVI